MTAANWKRGRHVKRVDLTLNSKAPMPVASQGFSLMSQCYVPSGNQGKKKKATTIFAERILLCMFF